MFPAFRKPCLEVCHQMRFVFGSEAGLDAEEGTGSTDDLPDDGRRHVRRLTATSIAGQRRILTRTLASRDRCCLDDLDADGVAGFVIDDLASADDHTVDLEFDRFAEIAVEMDRVFRMEF